VKLLLHWKEVFLIYSIQDTSNLNNSALGLKCLSEGSKLAAAGCVMDFTAILATFRLFKPTSVARQFLASDDSSIFLQTKPPRATNKTSTWPSLATFWSGSLCIQTSNSRVEELVSSVTLKFVDQDTPAPLVSSLNRSITIRDAVPLDEFTIRWANSEYPTFLFELAPQDKRTGMKRALVLQKNYYFCNFNADWMRT